MMKLRVELTTSWKLSHPISSVHHFRLNNPASEGTTNESSFSKKTRWFGSLQRTHHIFVGCCWVQLYWRITDFAAPVFLFNNFLGGLQKGFFTWIGLWFIYFFWWAPFSWEWVWVATKTFHRGFVKGAGHTRKLYCPWIYIDWWHGPLLGIFVMKALHNFIAWSFLFEIVMRFSSPSLLKKIDDLGKMVTFLEKSLQLEFDFFWEFFFGEFNGWQWEKDEIHLAKNPWAFWVVFQFFKRVELLFGYAQKGPSGDIIQ